MKPAPQQEGKYELWAIVARDGEPRAIGTDPDEAWENYCSVAFGGDLTESRMSVAQSAGKRAVRCTLIVGDSQ